jgi:hypothetical protein
MHTVKSLLLSSAGLASLSVAAAADLPIRKAAPVEYVRVCTTYGEGFFYIPGTEGCLRIGGRVRADYGYLETFTRSTDALGFRVRGRIQLDHRQATAYGLLRTFIRFEITRDSGSFFGQTGSIGTTPDVAQAFIQFGGLTAGRTTSFFDNPDLPTTHMGTLRFSDAPDVNVLAYTYSFGNGFSATLSLEDPHDRNVLGFPIDLAPAFVFDTIPLAFTNGGTRMPDVIGNVRYVGEWGSVQLAGAVHQIRDTGPSGLLAPLPVFADTDYGFAAALMGSVNLPSLGQGDSAWLALTYTDGAIGYVLGGSNLAAVIGAGPLGLPLTDAYVDPLTGDLKTTQAYSIAGGITHNWTPTVRSSLFGSYARFEFPSAASTVVPVAVPGGIAGTRVGFDDFDELRIGANAFWTPVSGLDIGVEAIYTKVDPRGRVAVPLTNVAGTVFPNAFVSSGSEDIWEGRLRVQRDF